MASISKVVKYTEALQDVHRQMRVVMGSQEPDLGKAGLLLDRQEAIVAKIQEESKVPRTVRVAS